MDEMVNSTLLSGVNNANLKIIFSSIIILILITIVASGIDFLLNSLVIAQINKYMANSKSYLLQLVAKQNLLNSLSRISIGLVYVFGSFILARGALPMTVFIATIVIKLANIFNICIINVCLNKCIRIYHDYYEYKVYKNFKPVESYFKVVYFLSWVITIILIVSYIFDRTPVTILTGIGAVSAFILILFKDTFLGIVASIQASASGIVKAGDWVIIDKFNINGTILDISINTVKIQNSDNTITSIPTYILSTEPIRNMQPMHVAGGRRFVEKIYINPTQVKFVSEDLANKLKQKYLDLQELDLSNVSNLTIFRRHIESYLSKHEQLNHNYATYLNTLASSIQGLPIEICAFTKEVSSVSHNYIKSEIIEYIIAILSDFELSPAFARYS